MAYHRAMGEVRECAQCGKAFTPRREHARFCSARCRMAWNREHVGVAAAPAAAIEWSVAAMAEACGRLTAAESRDPGRTAAAVSETVWWVTLVDATLVRYHHRAYESALASMPARRRRIEETLEGLRYVRNQLSRVADPARFIEAAEGDALGWTWRPLPEPSLEDFAPQSREWELSRYRAYQARLADRDLARTFARCARFLTYAATLASESAASRPSA